MLLFKNVMDNIVDFYKNNCKNKHTTKATNSWLRTYKHIGIVIVEFYIGYCYCWVLYWYCYCWVLYWYCYCWVFEPLLFFYCLLHWRFLLYMLGSSNCNSKRDKYINAWIRVQYRYIFLVFLFSELFGTRAYALVQITQKIKKTRKINPILHPNPCVNVYLISVHIFHQQNKG